MRHEDYNIQLSEKLKKQIPGSHRGFKDFLYHINKSRSYDTKILKLKVPKQRPKTISKEKVSKLLDCCSNIRDKFLIQLLWESSMRIGEALALWLEDFEIDARKIHIRDRGKVQNRSVWIEKNKALLERYETILKILKEGKIHHKAGKKGREYLGEERSNG
jgi:integrase/recombinase XerD